MGGQIFVSVLATVLTSQNQTVIAVPACGISGTSPTAKGTHSPVPHMLLFCRKQNRLIAPTFTHHPAGICK